MSFLFVGELCYSYWLGGGLLDWLASKSDLAVTRVQILASLRMGVAYSAFLVTIFVLDFPSSPRLVMASALSWRAPWPCRSSKVLIPFPLCHLLHSSPHSHCFSIYIMVSSAAWMPARVVIQPPLQSTLPCAGFPLKFYVLNTSLNLTVISFGAVGCRR